MLRKNSTLTVGTMYVHALLGSKRRALRRSTIFGHNFMHKYEDLSVRGDQLR